MKFRRRRRSDERLDSELQFHLDQQIASYLAEGLSPQEARRRAQLDFGGLDLAKEECRDLRPTSRLDTLARDLRYAARRLACDRAFTAVSVVVLGLGIGSVTAIFTVINELAIQTPPIEEPHRLAVIREQVDDFRARVGSRFPPVVDFFPLRADLRSFEDLTAFQYAHCEVRGLEEPIGVSAGWTPSNFAKVLGLKLLMGRWFTQTEDAQALPVVVLSEDFWRSAFRADPEIIGKTVELSAYKDHRLFTIIGVAPRINRVPQFDDIALFWPRAEYFASEKNSPSWTAGKLAPGVTLGQARAELADIQTTLFPDQNHTNGGNLIHVRSIVSDSIHGIRDGLAVLFAAAACVLLIACANIASLLLGRAAARRREMAVRAGLGATARRLFAQTITESLLHALLGGALGVFVAWAGVRGLMAIRYAQLPELEQASPDLTVLTFAVCVATVTALLFGALPAWFAARAHPFNALRQSGSTSGEGHSGKRVRQLLVAAEVAVSLVLVAGAGLLVRSMAHTLDIDPGFETNRTLSVEVRRPRGIKNDQLAAFFDRVESQILSVPGVVDAAGTDFRPLQRIFTTVRYQLPEQNFLGREDAPFTYSRIVTSGYFRMMKIPILAGETFSRRPTNGPPSIIISRTLAEQTWPGENAVGQTLILREREQTPARVAAVVEDTRMHSLTEPPAPMIYFNNAEKRRAKDWLIRTKGDPTALLPAVKEAIRKVDPTQPFRYVLTLDQVLDRETAEPRFYMFLLSSFAAIALVLAAVGLYGVVAFSVARRKQEIGVRMALGADRPRILRSFAAQGLRPALAGAALGLVATLLLSRFLEAWLYNVTRTDPWTLVAVCILFTGVATLASGLAARRAAKLHPLEALRYE